MLSKYKIAIQNSQILVKYDVVLWRENLTKPTDLPSSGVGLIKIYPYNIEHLVHRGSKRFKNYFKKVKILLPNSKNCKCFLTFYNQQP